MLKNPISQVFKVIRSDYEPSTNFLIKYGKGVIEARYVRKEMRASSPYDNKLTGGHMDANLFPPKTSKGNGYIACYVSSHNGCSMGCQFCHLTQNKDTGMKHVDIPTYLLQIETVLEHYKKVTCVETQEEFRESPALSGRCNVNFMSKGDALANKYLVHKYPELYQGMEQLGNRYNLLVKPNISTIMPHTVRNISLYTIFQDNPAYLYYSLYSINPVFRQKWLPNAIPYLDALHKLKTFQEMRKDNPIITFHWALIKGQNDQLDEARKMAKILESFNFNAKLNIVRFNPHPNVSDQEADPKRIEEIFHILNSVFKNSQSYIVPRLDVKTKTPCGMFVPLNQA